PALPLSTSRSSKSAGSQNRSNRLWKPLPLLAPRKKWVDVHMGSPPVLLISLQNMQRVPYLTEATRQSAVSPLFLLWTAASSSGDPVKNAPAEHSALQAAVPRGGVFISSVFSSILPTPWGGPCGRRPGASA